MDADKPRTRHDRVRCISCRTEYALSAGGNAETHRCPSCGYVGWIALSIPLPVTAPAPQPRPEPRALAW